MSSEVDRVNSVLGATAQGNQSGEVLMWDPETQRIRTVKRGDPDNKGLPYTGQDLGYSAEQSA